MKRVAKLMFVACVALVLAAPAWAADEPAKDKKKQPAAKEMPVVAKVLGADLSAEQKAGVEKLKAQYGPKIEAATKKVQGALSAEAKQARQAAMKKAREEGKKGKELAEAVAAAAPLTAEQAAAQEEVKQLQAELRQALAKLLTPEQQTATGVKAPPEKKKPAADQPKKKPAEGDKKKPAE